MTLQLTIDRVAWRAHVDAYRASVDRLVPVVKGNGYGIGRWFLAAEAASWAGTTWAGNRGVDTIAVGTVHEAATLGDLGATDVICLTPALQVPESLRPTVVPTVGHPAHIAALRSSGWRGRVVVKLASSMRRYGVDADELDALHELVRVAGFEVHSHMLHPPLPTPTERGVAEVDRWLDRLDPQIDVSLSHLSPDEFRQIQERHPRHRLSLRAGTALWHGDKSTLHLSADVVETRRVRMGDIAGYRRTPIEADGVLVMIGAGSAHGVTPLADGRSPFHFARHRLPLLESPHMHTTMTVAPDDQPQPSIGDLVDVQRPLISVQPDEVIWR